MESVRAQRQAESIYSARDLYRKSLEGQELTPIDALIYSLTDTLIGATDIVPPYGSRASDWVSEEGTKYGLTYADRLTMYTQSDRLLRAEPMLLNAHKRFLFHICGNGPNVDLVREKGKEHPLAKRLKLLLPDFPSLVRMIVSYTLKFGELYAVHFPIQGSELGRPRAEIFTPDKCRKIHVQTPGALRSKIIAYNFPILRQAVKYQGKAGLVPADAVTMFRVHEDLNDGLHGLSAYYVAAREVTRYADWLHSRGLRARANSVFLILRALKGASAGGKHELPDRPMIVDTNMGREQWSTIEAGGSARDASSDGYEFRMRVAQGVGLPEPDISSDARYGAQVQQGYATKLYEYYQQAFTGPLKRYVALTIGADPDEVILTWDFVDPRDRTARVNELSTLARDRLVSRAAVHRRLGYDHDLMESELKAELAEEAQAAPAQGLPTQLPLALEGPASLPATPAQPPAPGAVEKALPSALIKPVIPAGLVDVTESTPYPDKIVLGIDYGYAKNGAIVIGGPVRGGYAVVGEIRLHRTPLTGEASWESTLKELKQTFPDLTDVYVGSDAPEVIDLLKKLGFNVKTLKLGIPESIKKIESYRANGMHVWVHPRCKRLIRELHPEAQDAAAQSHVGKSWDFFDAFRYLILGQTGGQSANRD